MINIEPGSPAGDWGRINSCFVCFKQEAAAAAEYWALRASKGAVEKLLVMSLLISARLCLCDISHKRHSLLQHSAAFVTGKCRWRYEELLLPLCVSKITAPVFV